MLNSLSCPEVVNAEALVAYRAPDDCSWHLAADTGGREASVETWLHDLLTLLFLGEVSGHHGVFDCLHDGVYKSIPCVGVGEMSSLDVSFPES